MLQNFKKYSQLLLLLCLINLFLIEFSFSNSFEDSIYISSISKDQNFIPQRVGLIIENSELIRTGDVLQFSFLFDNKQVKEKCSHSINFINSNSSHRIVYCPIPTQENSGIYNIKISLLRNDKELYSFEDLLYYNSPNLSTAIQFERVSEGTRVSIKIIDEELDFPIKFLHEIPKKVLERLTLENKNSKIKSNLTFKIERENPIISWEVYSREQQIDYILLDREVDELSKSEFNTYPYTENTLNFVVIFSILILLIIIFIPLFFKSHKEVKN
ncbi:MAG: hypothetical protein ACMXYB_04650 [Candidatus Woesearchaeota archaeon]